MKTLTFAMLAFPGKTEQEAILFVKSLRAFGGKYSQSDVAIFTLNSQPLSTECRDQLLALNVNINTVTLPTNMLDFPFAVKAMVSGMAEEQSQNKYELLVWMDRDSLIIREPEALILPKGKTLGFRPVDHKNIGCEYDQPPTPFWQTIYDHLQVPTENIFPIFTAADQIKIRPYINAGMLVVRPEAGLLQQWGQSFQNLYLHQDFLPFYETHFLNKIFVHQAVLAALLTKVLPQSAWHELPGRINYPLHMHHHFSADRQPKDINDLITCRYDTFFETDAWKETIGMQAPFGPWLEENLHPSMLGTPSSVQ